jgi:hypothetical protein
MSRDVTHESGPPVQPRERFRQSTKKNLMASYETEIVIVAALVAVHFVFREAVFERAAFRKNKLSFPPVRGLRAIFWLGIPLFMFATYKVSTEIHSKADWLYPILYLGLACLVFFSYPGTICLRSDGITYRRYLGLVVKELKWSEVSSVVSSRVSRTITVYSRDGIAIVFTQFNVDPSRFETEVASHVRVPIIER